MDISHIVLEIFLRKQLKIYTKSRIRLTSATLKGSGFTPRFIKVNEYRERLEKYNIIYYVGINNEIYLKPDIGSDRLIEIFKNEFVEELTLAKLKNRK